MPVQLPAKGRSITVKRNALLIAAVRTKSLTINGSPIDVTNDDDAAVRKLLAEPGQIDVSISVEGVFKDELLIQEALNAADQVQAMEFGWPGATPGKIAGDFKLTNLTINAAYQEAGMQSATFESAGTVTFTAAL